MYALTPSFVFQYEKRMQAIREDEFARALSDRDTNYWRRISKQLDIDGASERKTWFLNTAEIRADGLGGTQDFDPLVTQTTELVPQRYKSGTKVKKDQLLDLRGGGLDILTEWSSQIGYKSAYFPQRLLSELIMNGANSDGSANAYDGVQFFADSSVNGGVGHYVNPWQPGLGGYMNWLHGAASGTYPGACPIDDSVTLDQAFINFSKVLAYTRGWKMPDGITPRFLRPAGVLIPPRMTTQTMQLLAAKSIAQAAKTGGGGADVEMIVKRWGMPDPIIADELASTTNYQTKIMQAMQTSTGQATGLQTAYTETIQGNDTTWYLVMEANMSSQLGGIVHVVREPFRTNYFFGEGGMGAATGIDAILNRALEIEYLHTGRMSMQYGHPYAFVRIDAS